MSLVNSFPGGNGGSGLPSGGTTGQVLAKKSNTEGDAEWINPVSTSDCFKTTDGYMGEAPFYDGDAIPIFTGSTLESRAKKLATWAKTKLALKAYFDTLYSTVKSRGTPASGGTALSLVTTGDMYNWNNPGIPVVANQFDKANIYSTTEKIVGCWTDGRPLYQKVINCGALPAETEGTKTIPHNIVNADLIFVIRGSAFKSDGRSINLPVVSKYDASANVNPIEYQVAVNVDRTSITYNINNIRGLSSYINSYVILQYTKTTDAANSFNYADENDYSTTEHIVGTWIDGKPLYQKTFNMGTGLTSSNPLTASMPANVDKVVGLKGIGIANNNVNSIIIPYVDTQSGGSVTSFASTSLITLRTYGSTETGRQEYTYYMTVQYTKTTD